MRLSEFLKQEVGQELKEGLAIFCLNVMEHNDSIQLDHFVGQDLKSKHFIKLQSIANQTKVGPLTA